MKKNNPIESKTTINFGPQHPAAHGVLRVELTLDGEKVIKAQPEIGFLHRGTEKLIETKTYMQAIPYFDRLDYVAPMSQEHAFVLAIEKLLNIKPPERAKYIRVLFSELTRILSHLLSISSQALDVGATTPLLLLFEEREKIMSFYERVSGARMHASYFIPGGVANDIGSELIDDIIKFLKDLKNVVYDVEMLLTENRIFKQRLVDIGITSKNLAIEYGFTGPMLRATGIAWDLRKSNPYEIYEKLDFDIPVGTNGDCYDRYLVRLEEIKQSSSIIMQTIKKMPGGKFQIDDPRIVPPNKQRAKAYMEDMINHFKIFSEGYSVPSGECYIPIESPKGEFGVYLISNGTNKPYRCKIRSPGFAHLQALECFAKNHMLSDIPAILGSMDLVLGEIDR